MRLANASNSMYQWTFRCLLIAFLFAFSACGFHLRGYTDLSFKTIYISNSQSELGRDLTRNMKNNGVKVVSDVETADISLEILHESRQKRILSLGGSAGTNTGAVREYELFYSVAYRLKDKSGKSWSRTQHIDSRRDFSYADAEALGKAYEESNLYDNMRSDTVRQMMRALAAYRPSVSNQPDETNADTPQ